MTTFETWLMQLQARRQRWIDASHENNFDRGIWNATVEKYADPTHFIFELLQNAEDAGATEAFFHLQKSAIVFEHNGRPFDRDDIEGITGIGNTTKLEQANKIGCFGIGFKSVYVVTTTPQVHCAVEGKPIAFTIRDLVIPELIATSHVSATTKIVLPLSDDKAGVILVQVQRALDALGPHSLLFLRSLTRLSWSDGVTDALCVVTDDDAGIRTLTSTIGSEPAQVASFLVLERAVRRAADDREYGVKIALRLNGAGDVIPETSSTRLAVFFETEEVTGLCFWVHGPFQLTDNRANIKRDEPWNAYLISELAALVGESLPKLRDRGLVNRHFLEAMPNSADDLPDLWQPILSAVVQAFQDHALVPAHNGGHVKVSDAVRGPTEIRDFLGDEGLATFAGLANRRWVGAGMRSSRTEAFLSTLKLREWSYADVFAAFQKAFTHSWNTAEVTASRKAQAWFDALPDDQVQRLYLLVDAAARQHKQSASLHYLSFVRLEDGTRAAPSKALLLPPNTPLDEEAASGIILVRGTLTRSGRSRGKDVEQFLRKAGVKEIGEADYISAIIRAHYADGVRRPGSERHLQHMRRVLRWFMEKRDGAVLENVAFFRTEGGDGYYQACDVYLDLPYSQNGLSRIYGGRVKGRDRRPLWSGYAKLKRADLLALLDSVGVEANVVVEETRIPYRHPRYQTLFNGFGGTRRTSTEINSDFRIAELPELIGLGDRRVSKMIWDAVGALGIKCMYARHAPNQTYEPHQELSTLALILISMAWVPAKDGSFRKPSGITESELADDFSVRGNDSWLTVIEFGAEHRRHSEQYQARRRAAQTIGLPAELADQLESLTPEARGSLANEMLQRIAAGAFSEPQFPEREAPNPERRAQRIAERTHSAPVKSFEMRNRSVRVTDSDVRHLARPYLRDLYTNDAGDMICQACHKVMPFRLSDGTYYFEAPELLQSVSVELAENHLALCPTCSAKWQHANDTDDAEISEAIQRAEIDELSLTLAGESVRLRFVKVHFDDLRTIFAATLCSH